MIQYRGAARRLHAVIATMLTCFLAVAVHAQEQTQATIADALLEAANLVTLAQERRAQSITDALLLAKKAEALASDETLRKAGVELRRERSINANTLSALRARIAALVVELQTASSLFRREYDAIETFESHFSSRQFR